jgi:outer membrane protein TolC
MQRYRFQLFALALLLPLVALSSTAQTSGPPSGPGPASNPSGATTYSGSVPSAAVPGVLPLSLQDAIDRGLKQNLGALLSSADIGSARGQRWQQLSALLPHVTASPYEDMSQVNLQEFGFNFHFPGVTVPTIVGPFAYFDARADVTQTLFDFKAIENTRAANQRLKSAEYSYKDARDLVVLSVGYAYLQAIADAALIDSDQAQVNTAQALYNQAADQVTAGTSPAIDALRAKVELQTQQQQLIQAKNNFAIQKINLARIIGLAPGQQFEQTDKSPYSEFQAPSIDDAVKMAFDKRSDYRAAQADVRAAEYSVHAAEAERYPTLDFSGNYGDAGRTLTHNHGVMDARVTLTIPIFEGGSIHGDILQAQAQLEQSRERFENLKAQIDADVRTSLLNLESASEQVAVATSNIDLANQTLTQSRDRFSAGVTDTVEVVQSQQSVATAQQAYISSLYSYNYAKISLARSIGSAEVIVKDYFKGK